MEAYYFSNATITKARKSMEKTTDGCLILKKSFYFQDATSECYLTDAFVRAQSNAAPSERFIIVTDYKTFMARDCSTKMNISVSFSELAEQYEFFLPLCGIEKHQDVVENVADVKAAQKMAVLFDEIKKDNLDNTEWNLTDKSISEDEKKRIEHNYALFFTRILFCLFADDTHIFGDRQFQSALELHTDEDGKNVNTWLEGLFEVLDLPNNKRLGTSPSFQKFPYVNGGLFREKIAIPRFTYKSRKKLIECGNSDWSQINPDIFGSMFQGVISPEQRSELGQHYTSVSNIMKVIKPLFLDDLHEELNSIKGNDKKLDAFRLKLSKIKVFDPACGSGNFLIIAYKELCRLEMEALDSYVNRPLPFLSILLENFYGIEIDEFPCDVARLSLWLAQHQINMECYDKYGNSNPTLPLSPSGNIVCGNACRLDWREVCPCNESDQVYICGNPPYIGTSLMNNIQREDREIAFRNNVPSKDLDYVSCWFAIASTFICKNTQAKAAFVTTNSISQGIQVVLWNYIFHNNTDIAFAYSSFKWKNNAQNNAGVTVTIIGLKNTNTPCPKYLYSDTYKKEAANISPYLIDSESFIVPPSKRMLSNSIPLMDYGTKFADGGNLLLSTEEKDSLILDNPSVSQFIHKLQGSDEFINGKTRWCLWIDDNQKANAYLIPQIKQRIEAVRTLRLKSTKKPTREQSNTPWKAIEVRYKESTSIIIPSVSSERREYIPMGYLEKGTVITNSSFALYDAPLWLFALLESKMHMAWMRTVCGRLKTDYRYSNTLCYNTFPFPPLNDSQKKQLEITATGILMARENHYEMTLAQQYNPDNMPEDLRQAHDANDLLVDSIYRKSGFANDDERLTELFKRYKKLVEEAK